MNKQLAELCRALSHPARIKILQQLQKSSCCNGEVVKCLPLAQSTISQHIKVLIDCNLLCVNKQQQQNFYCVNNKTLSKLKTLISNL